MLIEKDTLLSENFEVADKLNEFFIESVDKLNIEPFLGDQNNFVSIGNLNDMISKYSNHPSIVKIKENINQNNRFYFSNITPPDIEKEILRLDPKKANISGDIPSKMIIISHDIVSNHLSYVYNKAKDSHSFPKSLKKADVIPIHKKEEKTLAKNYRPVSLIPIVSKVFEKQMYGEIMNYIEKFLSPYLFGFRKYHSTEQCLTIMLEYWKKSLDKKGYSGAILTDLSKAFDCLNHDLLVSKSHAYGFSNDALNFFTAI